MTDSQREGGRDVEARQERLVSLADRFCHELQSSNPPSVEDYARRHPALAEEIRELFPALEMLEGTVAPHARAIEQLTLRFGPQVDPHVTLEDKEPARGDSLGGVLERLAERQGACGRYEVRGEVGRGGQGAVLAVWDGDLRRNLAMKLALTKDPAGHAMPGVDTRSLGRFLEEAQVTAQLDHPGIVPVHELGLDAEGDVYFTMKLVKGRDLRTIFELAREGRESWTQTRVLNVLLKVCEAMAYAHAKKVIHRDLKPSNVMVGKYGEVYVMDWGLARVLGGEDRKDIRIQAEPTEELRSLRHESADELDSPLVTMDGDVVGTPAYMSPEQARGELEAMGPHSDVYAVGAMLYQLLTGEMPYVKTGARLGNQAVWARVQEGPPDPVHRLAAGVPPELEAISDKAMARDARARYRDMSELAEDLRAYLEHRVVAAHETGAIAELRKWIRRNRALAGAIGLAALLLVAGLVSSLVLKGRADREREGVLRLSAVQELQALRDESDRLWPPWPEHVEAYLEWLDRAHAVVAGLEPSAGGSDPGHRARLAELEARALPDTAAQIEEDRGSHPRYADLAALRARHQVLVRARQVSGGDVIPEEVAVEASPGALQTAGRAWLLVEPNRLTFGREAEGLALARVAIDQAADDETYARVGKVLAWAQVANGLDEDAMTTIEDAAHAAPASLRPELDAARVALSRAVASRPRETADVRAAMEQLESQVLADRVRRFASEDDRWWHAQLAELIASIEGFSQPETGLIEGASPEEGWSIRRRLEWARTIESRTASGERARAAWSEAIASISDREQCPAYDGLVITPQLGLVPMGRDPRSGLWEFAHLLTGEIPERAGDGTLVGTEKTGLVLVLLPGGAFLMGAQSTDPAGPNHDPQVDPRSETPVHEVRLTPFFLSKYEMTQGQWIRMTGANPSHYASPQFVLASLLHPVEQLDWDLCVTWMSRIGFAVPSEAQWEYGARGRTTTVWSTGSERESLIGYANIGDQAARAATVGNVGVGLDWPELNDGFAHTARVHTLGPNPFGLHHVHGNVFEWCMDGWDSDYYQKSPVLDPVVPPTARRIYVIRGGSHAFDVKITRSAARYKNTNEGDYDMGLRPARAITGEIRYAPMKEEGN